MNTAPSLAAAPIVVTHGPSRHGVARFAQQLADAVAVDPAVPHAVDLVDLEGLLPGTPVHLNVTDRLWAASPEEAAEAVSRLARRHPYTVTFHDLPQPSDGARNQPRRAACYRDVARGARGVVCSSAHERMLLAEHVDAGIEATVIPLPIDAEPDVRERPAAPGDVGLLGFFYPGKGHAEAVRAARSAGATVTVLGGASPGHEADLERFVAESRAHGVAVEVTGYLDDAALIERCRRVSVPLVAHRHVSASGSLGSWIAAGRRPVVIENRYTREMALLRPGALTLVPPEGLDAAVAAALADPATTWLVPGYRPPHGWEEAGRAYRDWWAGIAW